MHTYPSSPIQTRLIFLAALAAWLFGPAAAVRAQTASPSPSPTPTGTFTGLANFWRCQLPGGVYLVALRNIQSVSSHEYIVDGAARVTEVTVATASSVEARFYYLEPVGASAASPLAGAASTLQGLQQRVQDFAISHAPVEPIWEKGRQKLSDDHARAHRRVPADHAGQPPADRTKPRTSLDQRQGCQSPEPVRNSAAQRYPNQGRDSSLIPLTA